MGDIALCVVGLLTQQVADGAELQTALKKKKKKTSLPMILCCHVSEGSKTDEEGLVVFTWLSLYFIKLISPFLNLFKYLND